MKLVKIDNRIRPRYSRSALNLNLPQLSYDLVELVSLAATGPPSWPKSQLKVDLFNGGGLTGILRS